MNVACVFPLGERNNNIFGRRRRSKKRRGRDRSSVETALITACSNNVTTYPGPDVDGLGVGDGRKLRVDARRLRGHGEERGDAERHARRDGVLVEPEAHPRHDDQHAAGHVDRDQVVRELPLEDELHLEAAVFSRVGDDVTVGTFVLLEREPGQVEAGHHLHRVFLLPLVDEVVLGPPV